MASVTFKRGTKAEIESTQIQDGQLLMETDQLNNNKIYLDLPNGTRVPVGGSGAWVGTKEEFKLAVEEGKIADGTQVIITDDYESGITASMTLYSNAQSGLVATNVQSAIDELDSTVDTLNSNLANNFIIKEYQINKTIGAKDTGNLYDIPMIDGYKLLSCNIEYLTATSNNIMISSPIRIYQSNTYRVVAYNLSSAPNTLNGSIYAMFVKNGYIL